MMLRVSRAFITLGAVLLGGAYSARVPDGSGVAAVDLSVSETDAPTPGALAGTVIDEGGAPVPNATVTAGSATATTDDSGAFSLAPTPGRVQLQASAKGRVSLFRSVGGTSSSPALRLRLVRADASQALTAAGGPLSAGSITLSVPSGAFLSGGQVAATWIARAQVSAASAPAFFMDQEGTRHRFVGQLDVHASSASASPVTLQVPVPAGTPGQATFVMYAIDGGEVGQRVTASSVANGVATFSVPQSLGECRNGACGAPCPFSRRDSGAEAPRQRI